MFKDKIREMTSVLLDLNRSLEVQLAVGKPDLTNDEAAYLLCNLYGDFVQQVGNLGSALQTIANISKVQS